MSDQDQNPFDGFSEEDGDDAVWMAVVILLALLLVVFWCWVVAV